MLIKTNFMVFVYKCLKLKCGGNFKKIVLKRLKIILLWSYKLKNCYVFIIYIKKLNTILL